MSKIRYIGDKGFSECTCDITDKNESIFYHISEMLNRTNQMFEYTGMPETIPSDMFELLLQSNGHMCITKVGDKLYALTGGFGGAPDPYYRPTLYIVASPALEFTGSLKILNNLDSAYKQDIHGECVVVKNDTNFRGMLPLYYRYASQLTENEISIRSAQINARQQTLITAQSDTELASANEYLNGVVAGKIGAIAEAPFLEGVKAMNVSVNSSNSIIQLIELEQYLKASWFNDIGLNANFNMKREYMSTEELQQSTDVLLPLVDDMLRCRMDAVDIVNKIYGTNITVKKNSSWDNKQIGVDSAITLQQNDAISAGGDSGVDIKHSNPETNLDKNGGSIDENHPE